MCKLIVLANEVPPALLRTSLLGRLPVVRRLEVRIVLSPQWSLSMDISSSSVELRGPRQRDVQPGDRHGLRAALQPAHGQQGDGHVPEQGRPRPDMPEADGRRAVHRPLHAPLHEPAAARALPPAVPRHERGHPRPMPGRRVQGRVPAPRPLHERGAQRPRGVLQRVPGAHGAHGAEDQAADGAPLAAPPQPQPPLPPPPQPHRRRGGPGEEAARGRPADALLLLPGLPPLLPVRRGGQVRGGDGTLRTQLHGPHGPVAGHEPLPGLPARLGAVLRLLPRRPAAGLAVAFAAPRRPGAAGPGDRVVGVPQAVTGAQRPQRPRRGPRRPSVSPRPHRPRRRRGLVRARAAAGLLSRLQHPRLDRLTAGKDTLRDSD